jgi:hypothetical protein
MEPKAQHIQDIALVDPIAAYGIVLGIPRVPISINASGTFSSPSVNQLPIEAGLDTTIAQRTWIQNLQYDIQQPNVFVGSIFYPQYIAYLRQSPGIAVRLTVEGGPRYLVSPEFTPLNNLTQQFNDPGWVAGWPLFKQQNISVEFMLTVAYPTTGGNTGPYNVTLTFNGWQFLDHTVDEISVDVAASKLRSLGFCVPNAVGCP